MPFAASSIGFAGSLPSYARNAAVVKSPFGMGSGKVSSSSSSSSPRVTAPRLGIKKRRKTYIHAMVIAMEVHEAEIDRTTSDQGEFMTPGRLAAQSAASTRGTSRRSILPFVISTLRLESHREVSS